MYHIAAFYHFADLPEFADWQAPLETLCRQHGLIGTILLASEGVNGTVAGTREGLEALLTHVRSDARFTLLRAKWSKTDEKPFLRMKIRLKKEIVSLGVQGVKPHEKTGRQVPASEWNELISDPDVVVIDTRNDYEVEVGTFERAVNPHTDSFREFPEYVEKHLDPARNPRVAMFCTGGIRCEKASAYMLAKGFKEVYQLQGGILQYLEDTPERDSLWKGECFVFDRRVTVDGELNQGHYVQCHACRRPLTRAETESGDYEKGVSCPHCIGETTEQRRASFRERQRQVELAKQRGAQHIGPD